MGDDTDLSDILAYLLDTQPSLFPAVVAAPSEGQGDGEGAAVPPQPKQLDKLIVLMLQYSPSMRTELSQQLTQLTQHTQLTQLTQQLKPPLSTQLVVDRFHKQLQDYDVWTTLCDDKKPTKRQWLIEQARLWLSTINNDQVDADEEDVDVDAATFQQLYQADLMMMASPTGVMVVGQKVCPQILYGDTR